MRSLAFSVPSRASNRSLALQSQDDRQASPSRRAPASDAPSVGALHDQQQAALVLAHAQHAHNVRVRGGHHGRHLGLEGAAVLRATVIMSRAVRQRAFGWR
jgi:hypothetical protein